MNIILIGDVSSKFVESFFNIELTSIKPIEKLVLTHYLYDVSDESKLIVDITKKSCEKFYLIHKEHDFISYESYLIQSNGSTEYDEIYEECIINRKTISGFLKAPKSKKSIVEKNDLYISLLKKLENNELIAKNNFDIFVYIDLQVNVFLMANIIEKISKMYSKRNVSVFVDLNFLEGTKECKEIHEKYLKLSIKSLDNIFLFVNSTLDEKFVLNTDYFKLITIDNAIKTLIYFRKEKENLYDLKKHYFPYRSIKDELCLTEIHEYTKNIVLFSWFIFYVQYLENHQSTGEHLTSKEWCSQGMFEKNFSSLLDWLNWLKRTQGSSCLGQWDFVNIESMFLFVDSGSITINEKCYTKDTLGQKCKLNFLANSKKYLYYDITKRIKEFLSNGGNKSETIFDIYVDWFSLFDDMLKPMDLLQ